MSQLPSPLAKVPSPEPVHELEHPLNRNWIALPRRAAPRWFIPRAPARTTKEGFQIFHPMTPAGRAASAVARALAGVGAFRLFPSVALPARVHELLESLEVPFSHVAAATSTHEHRLTAMLLQGDRTIGIAKVALDEDGRRALETEREVLNGIGGRVEGMIAPAVIAAAPGVILLEPIEWQPRSDPWRLEPEVAGALGRWHRATGRSHGDFAPWNLLRTSEGWALIDWEATGDGYPELFDVFHHLVQSYVNLGHPGRDELVDGLMGAGWIATAMRAYSNEAGIQVGEPKHHLDLYLRASEPRIPATEEGRRAQRLRGALAEALDRRS